MFTAHAVRTCQTQTVQPIEISNTQKNAPFLRTACHPAGTYAARRRLQGLLVMPCALHCSGERHPHSVRACRQRSYVSVCSKVCVTGICMSKGLVASATHQEKCLSSNTQTNAPAAPCVSTEAGFVHQQAIQEVREQSLVQWSHLYTSQIKQDSDSEANEKF